MKRFAIILAGCGVYDGAEIHESVMALYAVMKNGASYQVFAPDVPQHHVVNHINGSEMPEKRNVLIESARIARGDIKSLSAFEADDFDALLLPGGFGVAKNLCNFAFKGADCEVNLEVEKAIREMVAAGKPVGAMCISPVILAKLLGKVELTIGDDAGTATAIEKMGAKHHISTHGEVVVDKKHKIFTTPCYMLDANILQIAEGADAIVKAMLKEL